MAQHSFTWAASMGGGGEFHSYLEEWRSRKGWIWIFAKNLDIRQQRYRHSQTVNLGVLAWTLDYQFTTFKQRKGNVCLSQREGGWSQIPRTPIGYALVGEAQGKHVLNPWKTLKDLIREHKHRLPMCEIWVYRPSCITLEISMWGFLWGKQDYFFHLSNEYERIWIKIG